jgi:hypothetical protein
MHKRGHPSGRAGGGRRYHPIAQGRTGRRLGVERVVVESEVRGVLGHHWEPGEATVVTSQHSNGPAGSVAYREYLIDVRRAGGSPPFRTKLGVSYYGGGEATDRHRRFNDGDVFPVLCDVKREKAKWDYDDPRIYKPGQSPQDRKEKKKKPSEFDVAAAQPPGTPVTTGHRNAEAPMSDKELVRDARAMSDEELLRDPRAMAALLRQKRAASARDAGADDQLARLQELGELHASGVLTDAEFAEQKAKLLGH